MTGAVAWAMNETFAWIKRPPAHVEDAKLVDRCRANDAAACRELYQQHRGSVYRVVSRMIQNESDREEVLQDVFVQVFRSIPGFQGGSKLSTWIHRVSVNVVLQYIRRKKSRIRLQFPAQLPERAVETGDGWEGPEDVAQMREKRAAVQRALDALAPKKRVALVLHDFEGLPAKEIAEIVGAPALTVRTRLFYARKEFYGLLSQDPAFEEFRFEELKGS